MVFDKMYTDMVTLIKQDGTVVENIKATVEPKRIIILAQKHGQLPLIKPGDSIQRKMSNGDEETYKVIDPNFQEKFDVIPARYEMVVSKLGFPQTKSAGMNIFNVTGPNARFNQNSVDQSVNVVQLHENVAEKLEELRQQIHRYIEDENQRSEALGVVNVIGDQFRSGSPNRTVIEALVEKLPAIGNIASTGSFLLSVLS